METPLDAITKVCSNGPGHMTKMVVNQMRLLIKKKYKGFLASSMSTYDFSTLYTALPHNLIKDKLTELINETFNRGLNLFGY